MSHEILGSVKKELGYCFTMKQPINHNQCCSANKATVGNNATRIQLLNLRHLGRSQNLLHTILILKWIS